MAAHSSTLTTTDNATGTLSERDLVFAEKPTNPRFVDLTGRQFEHFAVLGYAGTRKKSQLWHAKCECGALFVAHGSNLAKGSTKSCGCVKTCTPHRDLTGLRFGKLLVKKYAG